MIGNLPPGLQGWVAADQMREQKNAQMLGALSNLVGIQGALSQQQMNEKLMPLKIGSMELEQQKMKEAMALAQQKQVSLQQFASQLPPEQRHAFMLSPDTFIKDMFGSYNLRPGEQRMRGDQPVARAPDRPTLTEVGVDGKPGFKQRAFVSPENPTPVPVGAPMVPDILNPDVQAARQKVARAGASRQITHVNAFVPASEEAQRDFIKSSRATYDQIKHAPVALQNIESAKALIPQAKGFMGPGGESMLEAAKFLNNRLGLNVSTEGVKSAEELRTRIFFNIMDNLKKMDAQPSQQQQMIMQESLGKLGTDPNALPAVLDAFADSIKGKVAAHNREVQSAIRRGVQFPYDPVIEMRSTPQQAVRRFNPKTGRIE
jgi:hypothetical protein